jgi:predicted dehydrogenase
MSLKFAFAGFGHSHINSLYKRVLQMDELTFVGACEPDEALREKTEKAGIPVAHTSLDTILDEVDCDVIAIGAIFGDRGEIAIEALRRGKHVIVDKPLCTRMSELDEIERLAGENDRRVGCMLTQRGSETSAGLRHLIRSGRIGDILAISFGGQHPLNLDSRPDWYFKPGKHGGTITDIFIHAADSIPWITGHAYDRILAARCWNALAPEHPHFEDGAQLMMTLDNGCGVLGDVSYFMPSKGGYSSPYYWRTTFFGSEGIAEVSAVSNTINLTDDGVVVSVPPEGPEPEGYLAGFLADIEGTGTSESLLTADVIRATRTAIRVQEAADSQTFDVALT